MSLDKDFYVKKINESLEFSNSGKYRNLLNYLVDASEKGLVPKEVTIAYEVFNIDAGRDSVNEANIRVYIHNLRKKLDTYYNNEGKDDKIILKIPKGRYKVEYVKRDKKSGYKSRIYVSLLFAIVLLLSLNIFYLKFYKGGKKATKNKSGLIWSDFVNSDTPVLVVIGDYYLTSDNTYYDRVRYIRDSRINSEKDFEKFLEEHPKYKNNLFRTKHTFLGKFAPICINELAEFFHSHNKSFDIIMSSDFKWQDLQKNNVIYIGSFKTLGLFNMYLKNSNFKFNIFPNELTFHQLSPDTTFHYFSFDSDVNNAYESDYPVITLMPGPNKHKVLLFIASRDIGLIAATRYFTNPEKVNKLEKEHFTDYADSLYFETCFKVQGLQRNVISIDLLNINHLNSSDVFDISSKENTD